MVKCTNRECSERIKGECSLEAEERDCGRDILHCNICGSDYLVDNLLERDRCPNGDCRSRLWDKEEFTCTRCGYTWVPYSDTPTYCSNCGKEIKKV